MKNCIFAALLQWMMIQLFLLLLMQFSSLPDQHDRGSFYAVLTSESRTEVEQLIQQYEQLAKSPLLNAYIGTLYLRLASLPATPGERIQYFRQGKTLLDREIEIHDTFVEMRFLRLMFQENSPGILKYKDDMEADKAVIVTYFHEVDEALKLLIRKYAESSEVLNIHDFEL